MMMLPWRAALLVAATSSTACAASPRSFGVGRSQVVISSENETGVCASSAGHLVRDRHSH